MVYNYILYNKTRQVLKIDSCWKVSNNIYTCVGCAGIECLLVLGEHLYISHQNGTIIETRVSDGHVVNVFTIPDVSRVTHSGSLYSKSGRIPDKQTLLLCNRKGEVFTFKTFNRTEEGPYYWSLREPSSVSYYFYNNTVYYIVCETYRHRINICN